MIQLAMVDFDDTLVATGPRFRVRREALFDRLEHLGFPRARSWSVHHEIVDRELLDLWGFGPFRLGASFRDTYYRLCSQAGRTPDPDVAMELEALADGIESPPPLIPGALEGLRQLVAACPTALYTQSSYPDFQAYCIEASGVLEVVPRERVVITPVKDVDAYRRAVETVDGGPPGHSVMIGNSMRSDVNPAIEAGAQAIWIDSGDPWHADHAPPIVEAIPRADSFAEAVQMLLDGGLGVRGRAAGE